MKQPLLIFSFLFLLVLQPLTAQKDTVSGKSENDVEIVTAAANRNFSNGFLGKFFFGRHYRTTWTTPVAAPVFELDAFQGGDVEILKLGGGHQTKTLRLQDAAGIQYNLRTIDKFPGKTLPKSFRGTWVNKLVKDQISTAHPYAFLTLPKLSEAVGVYHTHPQLVYLPKEAKLGEYSDYARDYGDNLFMVEVRPDEDLSSYERFGNSKNAVGTEKLFEELHEDNDNEINEEALVRARLFDMVIGDWDRHEDQWRWAEFEKKGKGDSYEPIPRDRDQVYAIMDGLFPSIVSSKLFMRRIGHFGHKIGDIRGMNWSARNLDRNLLPGVSRDTWIKTAKDIQSKLTDEIIDDALTEFPEEVYALKAEEIASKLKQRRDDLLTYANDYYEILAEEVRIAISDKHELFIVERLNPEETRVRAYKTEKDGDREQLLFDRTFYTSETREIRIYGLDGNDEFRISGDVDSGIKIRVIGGEGDDTFIDESSVGGLAKKTWFYDHTSEFEDASTSAETRVIKSDKPWVNEYNNLFYKFDKVTPRVSFEINPDDGLFLGAGIYLEDNRFRKENASSHLFTANWATKTNGFNVAYTGDFNSLIARNFDLRVNANGHNGKFAFNYFGQGNSSVNEQPIDFYRVSLEQFNLSASVIRRFGRHFSVGLGPRYQYANVERVENTILESPSINPSLVSNESQNMLGANFYTKLDLVDHPAHPSKGIRWTNEIDYMNELNGDAVNFARLSSELSLYYTPNLPFRVTFATRFGANTNIGDYLFYQSNFLGGQENLRGFRRTRFAGKGSVYQNTEARISLFYLRNVVLNGDVGLIAFLDHGKVWADDVPESNDWQRTYGPGAYVSLYDFVVLSAHYGITETEDNFFLMRMGFLF